MRALVVLLILIVTAVNARADTCSTSRDHILGATPGSLPMDEQGYRNLFKICLETQLLPNVKDAYLLRDGGIGLVPMREGIAATAVTLSQFCQRHPKSTLRFITRAELTRANSITRIVQMTSIGSVPCHKIVGNR